MKYKKQILTLAMLVVANVWAARNGGSDEHSAISPMHVVNEPVYENLDQVKAAQHNQQQHVNTSIAPVASVRPLSVSNIVVTPRFQTPTSVVVKELPSHASSKSSMTVEDANRILTDISQRYSENSTITIDDVATIREIQKSGVYSDQHKATIDLWVERANQEEARLNAASNQLKRKSPPPPPSRSVSVKKTVEVAPAVADSTVAVTAPVQAQESAVQRPELPDLSSNDVGELTQSIEGYIAGLKKTPTNNVFSPDAAAISGDIDKVNTKIDTLINNKMIAATDKSPLLNLKQSLNSAKIDIQKAAIKNQANQDKTLIQTLGKDIKTQGKQEAIDAKADQKAQTAVAKQVAADALAARTFNQTRVPLPKLLTKKLDLVDKITIAGTGKALKEVTLYTDSKTDAKNIASDYQALAKQFDSIVSSNRSKTDIKNMSAYLDKATNNLVIYIDSTKSIVDKLKIELESKKTAVTSAEDALKEAQAKAEAKKDNLAKLRNAVGLSKGVNTAKKTLVNAQKALADTTKTLDVELKNLLQARVARENILAKSNALTEENLVDGILKQKNQLIPEIPATMIDGKGYNSVADIVHDGELLSSVMVPRVICSLL